MKTYLVVVQKEHGKNANPINHTARVVVVAADEQEAGKIAIAAAFGTGVRRIEEVKAGSAVVVVR